MPSSCGQLLDVRPPWWAGTRAAGDPGSGWSPGGRSMASYMALEVALLIRHESSPGPSCGSSTSSATIISRMALMRSALEEHVLGAAQADALGAEVARPAAASRGLSALVQTFSWRDLSAQPIRRLEVAGDRWRRTVGIWPRRRCCRWSRPGRSSRPRCTSLPASSKHLVLVRRTAMSPQPETQQVPMPRATTAAWLVMPPRTVRMPCGDLHALDVLGRWSPGGPGRPSCRSRSASFLGVLGGEDHLAAGSAGRGGQALADDLGRLQGRRRQTAGAAGRRAAWARRAARPLPR